MGIKLRVKDPFYKIYNKSFWKQPLCFYLKDIMEFASELPFPFALDDGTLKGQICHLILETDSEYVFLYLLFLNFYFLNQFFLSPVLLQFFFHSSMLVIFLKVTFIPLQLAGAPDSRL